MCYVFEFLSQTALEGLACRLAWLPGRPAGWPAGILDCFSIFFGPPNGLKWSPRAPGGAWGLFLAYLLLIFGLFLAIFGAPGGPKKSLIFPLFPPDISF